MSAIQGVVGGCLKLAAESSRVVDRGRELEISDSWKLCCEPVSLGATNFGVAMSIKGVSFTTAMSVKECADAFRLAASQARGMGAKLGEAAARFRGQTSGGFFTPTSDSPFAAVDGVPDFAIGVHIGKMLNGAAGAGTTVHMYVDDRGGRREVQIVSPHSLGGGMRSERFVERFRAAFEASDPSLRAVAGAG